MRLLPRSLFGRLTLVLLIGLVAAQLLSTWFLLRDRGQTLYQSIREDTVARVAGFVRLLDALQPEERERLLPLLSAPETLVQLAEHPVPAPVPDSASVSALVERGLRRQLPPGTPIRVSVSGSLMSDVMSTDMDEVPGGAMGGAHGADARLHDGPRPDGGCLGLRARGARDGAGILHPGAAS